MTVVQLIDWRLVAQVRARAGATGSLKTNMETHIE
jgi:hypothetical protein